jgi:hypothetical protein
MKKLLLSPLLVLLIGCQNLNWADVITTAATLAGDAAMIAAEWDLAENPGHRPAYEAASAALDALLHSDDYTPQKLEAALSQLPIKELQGVKGALAIKAGVLVYDLVTQVAYKPDSAPAVTQIAQSISANLNAVLGSSRTRAIRQLKDRPLPIPSAPKKIHSI